MLQATERWRERRIREELEAYAGIDPSVTLSVASGVERAEAYRLLARRVCRTVAEKSAFTRVALLLRDHEGKFICFGSVGTDDLTLAALQAWGERLQAEEREGKLGAAGLEVGGALGSQLGSRSFSIPLGEWSAFDAEVATWAASGRKERRRWRRGIVAPIHSSAAHSRSGGAISASRLVGVIAVCADGERLDGRGVGGRGRDGQPAWTARPRSWVAPWSSNECGLSGGMARAMGPIETLASRLSAAMENEALAERLLKTEKLAGLGQLAGGVAHALNNPLTAVLGFAELIADTTIDPRVQKDAHTILVEARKMRDTVQRLADFWRPVSPANEPVDLAGMLSDMAISCSGTLRDRGVRLQLTLGAGVDSGAKTVAGVRPASVRGSRDRLRQVFEHLLNNAAQAIASARPRVEGEEHVIRLTVSQDAHSVHVIVSDTGPGFKEPSRIFDPFYTTRGPEQGAGLGLSICYGIVREHGGDISAFNLHPHGAAIIVQFPVQAVTEEDALERVIKREKAPARMQ